MSLVRAPPLPKVTRIDDVIDGQPVPLGSAAMWKLGGGVEEEGGGRCDANLTFPFSSRKTDVQTKTKLKKVFASKF